MITEHETCERLTEAAADMFAERGFRGASIREICRRANANVAAVHYHFGEKEALYEAVLRKLYLETANRFPLQANVQPGMKPEERLRQFIRGFLSRLLALGRESLLGRMVAREMAEPSPVLDRLVRDLIRPQQQMLVAIVGDLLGPQAPEALQRGVVTSILGQCVFFLHSRPVIERLYPEWKERMPEIDALAEHVWRFSMQGIRGMAPDAGPRVEGGAV